MTEEEWLVCDDPREMIRNVCLWERHTFYEMGRFVGLLGQNKTERRYRLFACGCMRQVWLLLTGSHSKRAVELAEQYVDSEVAFSDLVEVRTCIEESAGTSVVERFIHTLPIELLATRPGTAGIGVTKLDARLAAYISSSEAADLLVSQNLDDLRRPGLQLSNVFRDIFGNPYRPVSFSTSWRTDTAVMLARQMYDSRAFSAMPILADALQEAGCDNDDILNHCRDANQFHVRGCWVVDAILGQT